MGGLTKVQLNCVRRSVVGLLLIGCGGSPETRPEPEPFGIVADSAAVAAGTPRTLRARLEAVDRRLDSPALGSGVGSLAAGWQAVRARFLAALDDLGGADVEHLWGLDPDAAFLVSLGVVGGTALPRQVLAGLSGGSGRSQAPFAHLRLEVGVADRQRLLSAWGELVGRAGMEGGAPSEAPWIAVKWPADVQRLARQPADGTVWVLRQRGPRAAVDVLWMVGPDGPLEAAIEHLDGATPRPLEGLALRLDIGGVAALDAALVAADALRPRDKTSPAVMRAAGEVIAQCSARWATLRGFGGGVDLTWGETLALRAILTERGLRAWRAAVRPLPVPAGLGAAGVFVGLRSAAFEPLGPAWLEDIRACPAGPLAPLLAWVAAPAFAVPGSLPVPETPWRWPPDVGGMALWWTGFQRTPLGPVPATAFVVDEVQGWTLPDAPLGPNAVENDGRWFLEAEVPVALTVKPRSRGPAVILGVGRGAAKIAEAQLRKDCDTCRHAPDFLRAHFDPAAVARGLASGGEPDAGVDALAALATRLGRLEIRGWLDGDSPRLEARLTGPGDLDRGPAAE